MTEECEKELIRKRGSLKGRVTAFYNHLSADYELSPTDVSELQLRIGKLESIFDQYDEVQLKLECMSENPSIHDQDRISFEELYYKSVAKAQHLVNELAPKSHCGSDHNSSHTIKSNNNNQLVKLPTIQLPKFNGSYHDWLEFRDTFISLIHSNTDIDNINKFHYLRASLEGTAAVVIQ